MMDVVIQILIGASASHEISLINWFEFASTCHCFQVTTIHGLPALRAWGFYLQALDRLPGESVIHQLYGRVGIGENTPWSSELTQVFAGL